MNKQLKYREAGNHLSNLNTVIKISHYDEDKHVKTDVYPISHFLDNTVKEIKSIRYS